ncbi:ABC transporter ATP-binding protein [Thermococci archaeon]|nr:MAG: ABC transporter ATP-binding protein [Thermococci archaeon]
MISVRNISISYGTHKVIEDLSFNVKKGEIYGIIGPNGAGKTTILRALSGVILPDSGEIYIDGKNVVKYKPRIAVLFETSMTKDFLRITAEEDLMFYSVLYDVDIDKKRIGDILKTVGLDGITKYIFTYSRGMWQRLYFARVLLPDFPIIVLDEPWLGLDVAAQRETIELLKKMKEMRKTIILTAHEMPLIERICDRIMILDKGKNVVEGNVETLLSSLEWRYEIRLLGDNLENLVENYKCIKKKGYYHFYVKNLREFIESMDIASIYEIDVKPLSLEETYIELLMKNKEKEQK